MHVQVTTRPCNGCIKLTQQLKDCNEAIKRQQIEFNVLTNHLQFVQTTGLGQSNKVLTAEVTELERELRIVKLQLETANRKLKTAQEKEHHRIRNLRGCRWRVERGKKEQTQLETDNAGQRIEIEKMKKRKNDPF